LKYLINISSLYLSDVPGDTLVFFDVAQKFTENMDSEVSLGKQVWKFFCRWQSSLGKFLLGQFGTSHREKLSKQKMLCFSCLKRTGKRKKQRLKFFLNSMKHAIFCEFF
jgi:hypothetical protein